MTFVESRWCAHKRAAHSAKSKTDQNEEKLPGLVPSPSEGSLVARPYCAVST